MIALFDSGVGGVSILNEVHRALPRANLFYFGDTAKAPYGGRSLDEIRKLSLAALELVLTHRPDLVVVACNTATSVAITDLRAAHPEVPIVGVVPVLKTAAQRTTNRHVAVLATDATLASMTYKDLKQKFASHINVLELALPEWVTFVEKGITSGPAVEQSIERVAREVTAFGADVIVLGCTHFPFLKPALSLALPSCQILDSGAAVARQVVRVLTNNNRLPGPDETGRITWSCSGDQEKFRNVIVHIANTLQR